MIIKEENPCVDVGLHLALGLGVGGAGGGGGGGGGGGCIPSGGGGINKKRPRQQAAPVQFHVLFPSRPKKERSDDDEEACVPRDRQAGGTRSRLSLSPPVTAEDEEDSVDKDPRSVDSGGGTRKKLRLSKEQSGLLEESFRQQSTLNHAQKLELAQRLNLKPRQVEVWFQNRRARTKLKQTEVDCELLKRWCETLTDENRRLKRELQELQSMRTGNHPFFLHLHKSAAGSPAATSLCPSCEQVATPDGSSGCSRAVAGGGGAVLSVVASSPKFYSCAAAIKDSSVACCK